MRFFIDEVEVYFPYPSCYPEQYNYMLSLKQTLDASASNTPQTFTANFAFRTWSSSFENSPSGILGSLFRKVSRKVKTKVRKKLGDSLFDR